MGTKNILNRQEFLKAVDSLRSHYEEIVKTCKSKAQVGKYLTDKTGLILTESTVDSLVRATALTFEFKRKDGDSGENRRILMRAIMRLHEAFDMVPEDDLKGLYKRTFALEYKPKVT